MERRSLWRRLISSDAFVLNPGEHRIWFAQMLRGIAALCVVYFHLGESFWKDNDIVADRVLIPPLPDRIHPLYTYLTGWLGHNRIELGDYGVALFFLISGFVIPFSLLKVGNKEFFIRRCLRIYPTYFVGLSFTALVLYLHSRAYGLALPYSLYGFVANATLLYDIFPSPSIDGINWTLIVEMRFYLLCMLIMTFSSLRSPHALAIVALILCGLDLMYEHQTSVVATWAWKDTVTALIHHTPYLIFMLIGICFHNLFQGTWSRRQFWSMVVLLMALFLACAFSLPEKYHQWGIRLSRGYPLALVTFGLLYLFRHRLKPHPILNYFAEISYPLYVIHYIGGAGLMYVLFQYQKWPLLVFLESFAVFVFLASLLHLYIEVPSNRLGHTLTRKN